MIHPVQLAIAALLLCIIVREFCQLMLALIRGSED